MGKGVLAAVNNVNTTIQQLLAGRNAADQAMIDQTMIDGENHWVRVG